MSTSVLSSDADLLEMLRSDGPLNVTQMSDSIGVTATAVRQRLTRLMAMELIDRDTERLGRGRPRHRYQLTQKGLRLTGSNFTDLALALWSEVNRIEDEQLRGLLMERVVRSMADYYRHQIEGETTKQKMESLSKLLGQRRVPFSVEEAEEGPVLTAHACPYPDLVEVDPSICTLEQALFSEILGSEVELGECRTQGGCRCEFRSNSGLIPETSR